MSTNRLTTTTTKLNGMAPKPPTDETNGSPSPSSGAVRLTDCGDVIVTNLRMRSTDVADYLRQVAEPEREQRFICAVEVGVACLERASPARDLDFFKRQLEEKSRLITNELALVPGKLAEELRKSLGTKEGQVLAPVADLIAATEKGLKERLIGVQELFDKQIDPRRKDSAVGQALGVIHALLDPTRDGSVPRSVETLVKNVAGDNGILVATVRKSLDAELKPLREEIDRLAKEIRAREAVSAALEGTPAKGASFEKSVLGTIQVWAKFAGASVSYVGGDRKPGDFVIDTHDQLAGDTDEFRIVLEARDESSGRGRKRISDGLAAAMKTRGAQYGIYASKTAAGLAAEIGDWSEGHCAQGPFVACIADHLVTALRFALVETRVRALLAARPETDVAAIEKELGRLRTALRRIRNIKTKSADIQKGSDAIRSEADELQNEIKDAIAAIEAALRDIPAEAV